MRRRGQGSLEYLLILGAAVSLASIVILLLTTLGSSCNATTTLSTANTICRANQNQIGCEGQTVNGIAWESNCPGTNSDTACCFQSGNLAGLNCTINPSARADCSAVPAPPSCTDNDSDGYGTAGSSGCPQPGVDCDDGDSSVHSGAIDYCTDTVDNDCSGSANECTGGQVCDVDNITCITPPPANACTIAALSAINVGQSQSITADKTAGSANVLSLVSSNCGEAGVNLSGSSCDTDSCTGSCGTYAQAGSKTVQMTLQFIAGSDAICSRSFCVNETCSPAVDSQCSGTIPQSCVTQSGCVVWQDGVDCALSGQSCDDSGGPAQCVTTPSLSCPFDPGQMYPITMSDSDPLPDFYWPFDSAQLGGPQTGYIIEDVSAISCGDGGDFYPDPFSNPYCDAGSCWAYCEDYDSLGEHTFLATLDFAGAPANETCSFDFCVNQCDSVGTYSTACYSVDARRQCGLMTAPNDACMQWNPSPCPGQSLCQNGSCSLNPSCVINAPASAAINETVTITIALNNFPVTPELSSSLCGAGQGSLQTVSCNQTQCMGTCTYTTQGSYAILATARVDGVYSDPTYDCSGDSIDIDPPAQAFWDFDNRTGSTYPNLVVNAPTLTANVSSRVFDAQSPPSPDNRAVFFTGEGASPGYLSYDGLNGLDMSNSSYSLSFWIAPSQYSGKQTVFSNCKELGGSCLLVSYQDGRRIEVEIKPNGFSFITQVDAVVPGKWHHVVLSYNKDVSGGEMKLYINKMLVETRTGVPALSYPQDQRFCVGAACCITHCSPAQTWFMNGWLDDLYVYSGALNQTQVNSLFDRFGSTVIVPVTDTITGSNKLVAHWTMNSMNANNTIDDQTPNRLGLVRRNSPVLTSGRFGNAVSLSHLDQDALETFFIPLNTQSQPAGETGSFSISFWVKPPLSGGQTGSILSQCSSNGNNSCLHTYQDPFNLSQHFGFWGNDLSTGPNALLGGQWNHVVLVYNRPAMQRLIYTNGALRAQQPSGVSPLQNTWGTLVMGMVGNGWGDYYSGEIDQVRIYYAPLTSANVLALYNNDTLG